MNPAGLSVILFIFIATPLCGLGLGLRLSENFYIPNFIMVVVWSRPLFKAGYLALILFLVWTACKMIFVLHAFLLEK